VKNVCVPSPENRRVGFTVRRSRQFLPNYFLVFRAFLPKLNACDTDDDVAMCFLKNKEGFEKYLHYLVGQSLAESAVSDKAVHRFFKVTAVLLLRRANIL